MRRVATVITVLLSILMGASARGQLPRPAPPPEIRKWDVWIGEWALSGTARDAPSSPEYKVDWSLHERWILDGFFVQVDQTWKGNGQELHSLELLSYDPVRKHHTVTGFSSDGTTWHLTAGFDDARTTEDGISTGPDGQATACHTSWVFSSDRKALSGTQECEQSGIRWVAFRVQGTKTAR